MFVSSIVPAAPPASPNISGAAFMSFAVQAGASFGGWYFAGFWFIHGTTAVPPEQATTVNTSATATATAATREGGKFFLNVCVPFPTRDRGWREAS